MSAIAARPSDRILDVATGTGLVAAELARRYGCRVIGIDQSEEMLSRARRRLAREPHLGNRVEMVAGEAERLPFDDGEFDGADRRLPAALRRRSGGDDPRAGAGRETRRDDRVRRVRRPLPRPDPLPVAAATRATGSRPWAGSCPGAGRRWGSFLSHSIPEYYERHPLERQRETGTTAGIVRGRGSQPMSFGAGVVISGTRMPARPATAGAARVLRAAPRRMARSRHAPPPSLHGLASELCGARRGRGADAARRALAAALGAFFLGVGICAHALDELNGRPLGTAISDRTLIASRREPGRRGRASA